MKRFVFALTFLILTIGLWSAPLTLTVVLTGAYKFPKDEEQIRGYATVHEMLAGKFEKANPGTKVQIIMRDITHGSMTVDALMAAGKPPDVWLDAADYFDKYLNADYALPLEKYIDVSIYQKDLLDLYTRDGHVYGLPESNIGGAFAVNLDMLDSIGYTLPDQPKWTTDEFLVLSGKLKAAGIPATMVMGKGGFGTWTNIWLYAFGADFFKGKDYSRTIINSKEALAGLNYIKTLMDRGYSYPYPEEQNDDAGVELFTTGKVFSCVMQNGHSDYWIPEQVKQGKITKAMKITFVEVPHAPGRKGTPVYSYQAVALAHNRRNETENKLVAKLAEMFAGKEMQWYNTTVNGGFSTIKGFQPEIGTAGSDSYRAIAKLLATSGFMNEFPRGDKGSQAGRIWGTLTEAFVRGKISAQELLNKFELEANKVLK